jgi:hypothetical protein
MDTRVLPDSSNVSQPQCSVLTLTRYTGFITHLYSQPIFSFRDWDSFAVFAGSVLPVRFESIQNVCVHETQGFRDDYCPEVFVYNSLHLHAIRVHNPVLPIIPSDPDTPFEVREWIQTEQILEKMPALQEVTIIFWLELSMAHNETYLKFPESAYNIQVPRSKFETFWAARKAEKWANFDVLVDEYPYPDYNVKVLRKKRSNA